MRSRTQSMSESAFAVRRDRRRSARVRTHAARQALRGPPLEPSLLISRPCMSRAGAASDHWPPPVGSPLLPDQWPMRCPGVAAQSARAASRSRCPCASARDARAFCPNMTGGPLPRRVSCTLACVLATCGDACSCMIQPYAGVYAGVAVCAHVVLCIGIFMRWK